MNAPQESSPDNWSSILSDLGFNDAVSTETESPVKHSEEKKTVSEIVVETRNDAIVDPLPESDVKKRDQSTEVVKSNEPKKRFFDRFPKIDLFGPAKEKKSKSLESIAGDVRSPSLSGKSFTSHTIEKVPVSPERALKYREKSEQQKVAAAETKGKPPVQEYSEKIEPVTAPLSIDVDDPWAHVAAQVGILSTEESKSVVKVSSEKQVEKKNVPSKQKRQEEHYKKAKKETAFVQPLSSSDEAAALSILMEGWDNDSRFDKEAEKRLNSILEDERKNESPFGFDREENTAVDSSSNEVPYTPVRGRREERFRESSADGFKEEREMQRRSYQHQEGERSSFRDRGTQTKPDNTFGRQQEERPVAGRRGSRYQEVGRIVSDKLDKPAEEKPYQERRPSSYNTEQSKQVEYSGRRGRRTEEPKRDTYVEPTAKAESDLETAAFKGIPTWDEAIMVLIEKNAVQHSVSYRRR